MYANLFHFQEFSNLNSFLSLSGHHLCGSFPAPTADAACILASRWQLCKDSGASFQQHGQRGPINYGPARRIAERPFTIVAAAALSADETASNLELAVFIANQFALTSDTHVAVVDEAALARC